MTKYRTAQFGAVLALFGVSLASGQNLSPGQVNYLAYAQSNFDVFTYAPTASQLQWFQNKVGSMVVWSPYFDTRTSWFPNAYFYQNMYGIEPDSWVRYAHPEWILHDRSGNWLYIPFGCG